MKTNVSMRSVIVFVLASSVNSSLHAVESTDLMCGGKCDGPTQSAYDSRNYDGGFRPACTMYLHDDFRGDRFSVYANSQVSFVGNIWNDQVSSVSVANGCRLVAYYHANFQKPVNTFGSGNTGYVGNTWNDQISSVKCTCN